MADEEFERLIADDDAHLVMKMMGQLLAVVMKVLEDEQSQPGKHPTALVYKARMVMETWNQPHRPLNPGEDPNSLERTMSEMERLMFVGFGAYDVMLEYSAGAPVCEALRRDIAAREARAKGGKATSKLGADDLDIAAKIFSEVSRGISKTAAFDRTAARLRTNHNIAVSAATLRRRLDGAVDFNAER